MTIKLKVIKATPPTWYHNQIGDIFYANNKVIKGVHIERTSQFGIPHRFYFDINDIQVLEGLEPVRKRPGM